MFVPVEVCQLNSRAKNPLNLRAQFQFDFTKSDFAGRDLLAKTDRANAHLSIAIDQAWHYSWRRYRWPLSQIQVRADSQSGRLVCARHRILERASVRHQAGAGYHAAAMCLDDPLINALSETEIISRDNQLLHHNGAPTSCRRSASILLAFFSYSSRPLTSSPTPFGDSVY